MKEFIERLGIVRGIFYYVITKLSAKRSHSDDMMPGGEFRRAAIEVYFDFFFYVFSFFYFLLICSRPENTIVTFIMGIDQQI